MLPVLELKVDVELKNLYEDHVNKHNDHVMNDPHPNSGFDIYVPIETTVPAKEVLFLKHNISCSMVDNIGYYLYPRSSISKTPLMMANHVGIIDCGYRGNIIGALRNLDDKEYVIPKHTRLFQICSGDLKPFTVNLVSELGDTSRGEGGFGSTNR